MESKLFTTLKLTTEPVAVYFTDTLPEDANKLFDGKKVCVATCLVSATTKGRGFYFDRNTYVGCPGGSMGLGFDNTYGNFPIECLLSTGDEGLAESGKVSPFPMGIGERFFTSPEVALRWRKACLDVDEIPSKYVILRPFSKVTKENPPNLVAIFANPDQLSALITMAGFYRGDMVSVKTPFGAACQAIAHANSESKKEKPDAVLGFFDISQRHALPKELLSFTISYAMYEEMEKSVDRSLLTTEAWEKLDKRL